MLKSNFSPIVHVTIFKALINTVGNMSCWTQRTFI